MHVYEVTPGIYMIFSLIASLKTYRHGYFSKQQNETGYFYGMTLYNCFLLSTKQNAAVEKNYLAHILKMQHFSMQIVRLTH